MGLLENSIEQFEQAVKLYAETAEKTCRTATGNILPKPESRFPGVQPPEISPHSPMLSAGQSSASPAQPFPRSLLMAGAVTATVMGGMASLSGGNNQMPTQLAMNTYAVQGALLGNQPNMAAQYKQAFGSAGQNINTMGMNASDMAQEWANLQAISGTQLPMAIPLGRAAYGYAAGAVLSSPGLSAASASQQAMGMLNPQLSLQMQVMGYLPPRQLRFQGGAGAVNSPGAVALNQLQRQVGGPISPKQFAAFYNTPGGAGQTEMQLEGINPQSYVPQLAMYNRLMWGNGKGRPGMSAARATAVVEGAVQGKNWKQDTGILKNYGIPETSMRAIQAAQAAKTSIAADQAESYAAGSAYGATCMGDLYATFAKVLSATHMDKWYGAITGAKSGISSAIGGGASYDSSKPLVTPAVNQQQQSAPAPFGPPNDAEASPYAGIAPGYGLASATDNTPAGFGAPTNLTQGIGGGGGNSGGHTTMYDSAQISSIPANAPMVAYYPWTYGGNTGRFKSAKLVKIDTGGSHGADADVADVEPGCISVGNVKQWLKAHQKAKGAGTGVIYSDKSDISGTAAALQGMKYFRWVADPTGTKHDYPGAAATQWSFGSSGGYDTSDVVNVSAFGGGAAPVNQSTPTSVASTAAPPPDDSFGSNFSVAAAEDITGGSSSESSGFLSAITGGISGFVGGAQSQSWLVGTVGGSGGTPGTTGTTPANASGLANTMLNFMISQEGKPYSLSATTGPNSYDCEGLVWAAAKHAGVNLPDTTEAKVYPGASLDFFGKYPGVSLIKDVSQLQKGDLVWFGNTGAGAGNASVPKSVDGGWSGPIGHVGMAVSSSRYVSAFGPPVDVRPLDHPFAVALRLGGSKTRPAPVKKAGHEGKPSPQHKVPSNDKGAAALGTADSAMLSFFLSKIGHPYSQTLGRFGPHYYDCSGLFWAAAHSAGVNFPQSEALANIEMDWLSTHGATMYKNKSQIKRGDALGFTGDGPGPSKFGGIGHIGMATSPTKFVSALGTAFGVCISDIQSDFVVGAHLGPGLGGGSTTPNGGNVTSGGADITFSAGIGAPGMAAAEDTSAGSHSELEAFQSAMLGGLLGGGGYSQWSSTAANGGVAMPAGGKKGQPGVGPNTPSNGLVPANASSIAAYLKQHGLNKIAIAGILGNIMAESGGDPNAGSNPPGKGLIQILGDPGGTLAQDLPRVIKYINANGSISDINAHASNPTTAADWFMNQYERPQPGPTEHVSLREGSAVASYKAGYAAGGDISMSKMAKFIGTKNSPLVSNASILYSGVKEISCEPQVNWKFGDIVIIEDEPGDDTGVNCKEIYRARINELAREMTHSAIKTGSK